MASGTSRKRGGGTSRTGKHLHASRQARRLGDPHRKWILTAALLLLLFIAVFVPALVRQVYLILPIGTDPAVDDAMDAVGPRLARDPIFAIVNSALRDARAGRLDAVRAERYREHDPHNGLYDYLLAWTLLRQSRTDASTLPSAVQLELKLASPVRLHHARQRRMIHEAFAPFALDPRHVENLFQLREMWIAIPPILGPPLRAFPPILGPPLRALTDDFLDQAKRWREGELDEDAASLEHAVARLAFDLVNEDSEGEHALLAADLLGNWADHLRRHGNAQEVELADRAIAELDNLRPRWHEAAGKETNLLPYTYSAVWAPRAHQRVMSSLVASALAILTAVMLFLLTGGAWLTALLAEPRPIQAEGTPSETKGVWLRGLLLTAPLIVVEMTILLLDIPWTWIISYPTWIAARFLPLVLLTLFAAGLWMFAPPRNGATSLMRVVGIVALLGYAMILIAGTALPWGDPVPGLPDAIRQLRWILSSLGGVSFAAVILLPAGAFVDFARNPEQRGPLCRRMLAMASRSLLIAALAAVAFSVWNLRQDTAHRAAFAQAMEAPITSRLGTDWKDRYFGSAEALHAATQK